jgi:hypothetical protein
MRTLDHAFIADCPETEDCPKSQPIHNQLDIVLN